MKYLEAQYHCVPGNIIILLIFICFRFFYNNYYCYINIASLSTTTLRPNPPWFTTSQPSVWNADKLLTLKPATPIPPMLSSPQSDDIIGSSVEEEPVSVSTTTSTSTAATSEISVINNYKDNNTKTDNEQHLQSSKFFLFI